MNRQRAHRIKPGASVQATHQFFGTNIPQLCARADDDRSPDGQQIPEGAVGTINGYMADDPGLLDVSFTLGECGTARVAAPIDCIDLQ